MFGLFLCRKGGDLMSMYTKSGFSRSFGCCSHWKVCDFGKETCVYQEKDPETMNGCNAWNRNNIPGRLHPESIVLPNESDFPLVAPLEREESIKQSVAKEQLTLF